jgi:hypothetical protein
MLREDSAVASSLRIHASITFDSTRSAVPPLDSDSTQAGVSWAQEEYGVGSNMEEMMQREEILDRYRHLRAISARYHSEALDRLAGPAILEQAKHLGLTYGQALLAETEEELALIFDLAIHTAKPGRSRAIDRYTKGAKISSGADEAYMLEAMRQARFSVWRIERRHQATGLIVADLLRDRDTWLVDEGLTLSAEPGMTFASRLCWPADFAITCGVVVPVNADLMEEILLDSMAWLRHVSLDKVADDPRFATAIYRAALEAGIMDGVVFKQPAMAA